MLTRPLDAPRLLAVAVLASLNLAAGLWLSTRPTRGGDLQQVVDWTIAWSAGANPYSAGSVVDYPPWALVALWPLSALAPEWRQPLWVLVNAVLLAVLLSQLTRQTDEPVRIRIALALLLAATAPARTLNQFSLLAGVLAMAGASATSNGWGGLALGLSLIKPQIAGVVLIWICLKGQWSRAGLALAVPALLTAVFLARAGDDPAAVLGQYAGALAAVHGGADPLPGHTELRPWLLPVLPDGVSAASWSAGLAALLILPGVVFAARRRSWTPDEGLALLALCGAASLLAVRHLSYDLFLLWPALLAWRVPPFARGAGPRGRGAAFAVLSALLVLQLPSWARLAARQGAGEWWMAVTEVDRVLVLVIWIVLSCRLSWAAVIAPRSGGQR